jgi:hypothetical protein
MNAVWVAAIVRIKSLVKHCNLVFETQRLLLIMRGTSESR